MAPARLMQCLQETCQGWWLGVSRAAWDLGIQEAFLEDLAGAISPGRVHRMQDAQTVLVGGCCCPCYIRCIVPVVFSLFRVSDHVHFSECYGEKRATKHCFPLKKKKKKTTWLNMYIHESLCKLSKEEAGTQSGDHAVSEHL